MVDHPYDSSASARRLSDRRDGPEWLHGFPPIRGPPSPAGLSPVELARQDPPHEDEQGKRRDLPREIDPLSVLIPMQPKDREGLRR